MKIKYSYDYSNDNEKESNAKPYKKEGIKKLKNLPNIESFEIFILEVEDGIL